MALIALPNALEVEIRSVRKRRTYLLTGYEPLPASAHHHRFAREIGRFEKTWSLRASVGAPIDVPDAPVTTWQVDVSGPDFAVETDVRLLRWDDIVAEDMDLPVWKRLPRYLVAAGDILLSGTFIRYALAYWRYALFAAYPLALLAAFAALAWIIPAIPGRFGQPLPGLLRLLGGLALFAGLVVAAGPRLHLTYMLSDWIFARDMIRRHRPAIERRAEAFAREIAAGLAAGDVDEVVIVAHSLGAVWMLDAVARVEAVGSPGTPPLGLAGVGSSTLKIALHPAASWLRDQVQRVADRPAITWAEYDSHVDFICFYKNNTVEALGLTAASRPLRQSIRLSRMLSPHTWKRFRGNLLRIHRQYVMGNEQRYAYDFHMIACGPFRFADIVSHGTNLPGALGPDGALSGATTPFPEAAKDMPHR
ncbi:MAG: hypothetical protein Q8O26_12545 [Phreatobacter sp.]|uniref:hypothetical protein n=1 Tax=Phreatobacter sp. TaxID=1966341 RepID=UPI002736FA8B|nr:hypothetical protein [Phreatobacter sp.]MDP2802701.1 hypothetical protein [Phreatobacter sp.]